MTRAILVGVIVGELLVGGFLLARRLREATPPKPDVSFFDPVTAEALRLAATDCEAPEQWAELGELYLAHGFFLEGEACLREASARLPEDADLAFRHGFALERFGKLDEANARYSTAIQLGHKRTPDIYHYLGRNFLRLEQVEPAREAFAKAGDMRGATYELARIDLRAGRIDAAEGAARSLATHSRTAQPIALQFRIAIARWDRATAIRLADQFDRQSAQLPVPFDLEFGRLNKVHDQFGIAGQREKLAQLLASGTRQAADQLAQGLLADEWTPAVADHWAEVAFQQGRPREAITRLEEAIARDGPAWPLLERLGDAYSEAGDAGKALVVWERAARLGTGPELKNLRHKLALDYEKAGRQDVANSYHALAALSAGIEAHELLIALSANIDAFVVSRQADLVSALTEATQRDPRLAHAWFYLGEDHRLRGQSAEARAAYEKCLQLDPDHGRAIRGQSLLP